MKLSIIIPCFNEEHTIKDLLSALFDVNFPIEREILVVDDGSTINHKEILQKEINSKKLKFIRIPNNQGKGVAIRIGLKYATGDIFIIQDADFEYFPEDIPQLLEPILNEQSEVVYGSRFFEIPEDMAKTHYLANKFLTFLTNLLYRTNLTDMETGYKLFTKNVLNHLTLKTREFEFEPELTSKIILNGFKIKELPIRYHYRKFGNAKINWMDGLEGLMILIQNRFCPSSPSFQFFYNIYKNHFKKIVDHLTKFIAKRIHMRRI